MKSKSQKIKSGFVLLFALLVSSILLAAGLGISRIVLREILLASLSRESSVAFFAADMGAECALHWYQNFKFDLDSSTPPPSRQIFCNGQAIRDGESGPLKLTASSYKPNVINGGNPSIFSFLTDSPTLIAGAKNPCSLVKVSYHYSSFDHSFPIETVVDSNGYDNCDLTSPQTIERTIQYTLCTASDPACH